MHVLSKSQLKAQLLAALRLVEKERMPLLITHGGKPVVQMVPFTDDPQRILNELRGSVLAYQDPVHPVGEKDGEALEREHKRPYTAER
jgi:antitoxin (DNA-binding transcriptional repressor) of toxin-antitoxin stability system